MRVPERIESSPSAHRGSYFFLSYAHQPPAARGAEHTPDPWVRALFRDLSAAVSRLGATTSSIQPGFVDLDMPVGSDWNAELAEALGAAGVFVPLYAPSYFTNSWSLRERAAFEHRLHQAGVTIDGPHVVPVLWVPLPPWDANPDVLAAYALGEDLPAYRENGLRAMCMLSYYQEQYSTLVERLAERIVQAAELDPLRPSPAPSPDEVEAPALEPSFVAAVLAPADGAARWRPFAGRQELPAAAYVANTAERLGLPAVIKDFGTADELLSRYPAVLVIDPWTLDQPDGEHILLEAIKNLPPWVVPLVVVDEEASGDGHAAQLAAEAMAMLGRAGIVKAEQAGDLDGFIDAIPALVTEARRQFLRLGPIRTQGDGPGRRWRLSDADE